MKIIRPLLGEPDITQPFGPTSFVGEPPFAGFPHFHQGVDYACPIGTPVRACAAGLMRLGHDDEWGYGIHALVDHLNGVRSLYGHLSEILFKDGEHVSAGTTIARSGNTGNSTGPHLHWGLLTAYDYPIPPAVLLF